MDYLELFTSMLASQTKFVADKIPNKKGKVIFLDTIQSLSGGPDSSFEEYSLHFAVTKSRILENNKLPNFFVRMTSEDNSSYKELAIDLVQDIILSINTRFIDGGFKLYVGTINDRTNHAKKAKTKQQAQQLKRSLKPIK